MNLNIPVNCVFPNEIFRYGKKMYFGTTPKRIGDSGYSIVGFSVKDGKALVLTEDDEVEVEFA